MSACATTNVMSILRRGGRGATSSVHGWSAVQAGGRHGMLEDVERRRDVGEDCQRRTREGSGPPA